MSTGVAVTGRSRLACRLRVARVIRDVVRMGLPAMVAAFYVGLGVGEAVAATPLQSMGQLLDLDASCLWRGAVLSDVLTGFGAHLSAAAEGAACPGLRGIGFAFLGLAALVLIAVARIRHATEQRRLELARQFVEKGIEPPVELLGSVVRSDLRKGMVLLFAGLGVGATAWVTGDQSLAPGGLIPGFIGVGYLVSFWLASRSRGSG